MQDGTLERFHALAGTAAVPQTLISEHCVWSNTPFASWDAESCFSTADRACFCIIQSNNGVDPSEIWQRVRGFLET